MPKPQKPPKKEKQSPKKPSPKKPLPKKKKSKHELDELIDFITDDDIHSGLFG